MSGRVMGGASALGHFRPMRFGGMESQYPMPAKPLCACICKYWIPMATGVTSHYYEAPMVGLWKSSWQKGVCHVFFRV